MQEEVCPLCEGVSERIVAEVMNFAQRDEEHSGHPPTYARTALNRADQMFAFSRLSRAR